MGKRFSIDQDPPNDGKQLLGLNKRSDSEIEDCLERDILNWRQNVHNYEC